MNKGLSIALIIIVGLLILCLVAVLIFGTLYPSVFTNFFNFESSRQVVATEAYTASSIKKINVDTNSLRVTVKKTNDTQIKIILYSDYSENRRGELTVSQSGDEIYAEAKSAFKIISIWPKSEHVEVLIPASYSEDVMIETSSGKLVVDDSFTLKNAQIKTTSGSLHIGDLSSETYDISSTSGSIKAGNIEGEGYVKATSVSTKIGSLSGKSHQVRSSSGSVSLGEVMGDLNVENSSGSIKVGKVEGEISVKNSSGSINIEEMTGYGSVQSSSGSVKVSGVRLEGDLSIKNSSGSVKVYFAQTPSAEFKASSNSGSVKANFDSEGNNGYLTAKLGDGEHTVNAQTTSGSIRFEI